MACAASPIGDRVRWIGWPGGKSDVVRRTRGPLPNERNWGRRSPNENL